MVAMPSTFLPEEKLVMDALKCYGCLNKEQLIQLLYFKDREIALKILKSLQKGQYILVDEESLRVKIDKRCEYDPKTEIAFWVLLKFIDKIKPEEHYPAEYPSEIYFLKEGKQYEIAVIQSSSDEYLLNIIAKNFIQNAEDSEYDDEIRYIIAIPNETMIPSCAAKLKGIKKLFAVYGYDGTSIIPTIKFVKEE